jgi:multiple sugar transport system permease protein
VPAVVAGMNRAKDNSVLVPELKANPHLPPENVRDSAPLSLRGAPVPGVRRRRRVEAAIAYAFVSPALLLFLIFLAGPLVAALALSLQSWNLLSPPAFVGLANYRKLFADPIFLKVALNTAVFTVGSVVLHLGIGLGMALLVNRRIAPFLQYMARTAFFFPQLISWAAAALIWRYILDPDFGFFNFYLKKIGIDPPAWLASPGWAMPALLGVDAWRTIGFIFIVLLAGLQSIPSRLYEAAMLDGANAWRRFWDITLPMLSPTMFFVVVINFIGAIQVFEPMYIMTNGGPLNQTRSIVMYVFETAFRKFQMGYASTMANVIFVAIMMVTLLQFVLARYWVRRD